MINHTIPAASFQLFLNVVFAPQACKFKDFFLVQLTGVAIVVFALPFVVKPLEVIKKKLMCCSNNNHLYHASSVILCELAWFGRVWFCFVEEMSTPHILS